MSVGRDKKLIALDLCCYELQAEHDMEPMGLMGIDMMERVARERIANSEKLLRQLKRLETLLYSAARQVADEG